MEPRDGFGDDNGDDNGGCTFKSVPTTRPKPKIKRSRNGCLSCKKLKIKCDEVKPYCEYCIQTNKQCIYPKKPPVKLVKKSTTIKKGRRGDINGIIESSSINNDAIKKLNSQTSNLGISKFELQLLKFFLDFGASFFSFNKNKETYKFWNEEVPKFWCESDLVKNALYSMSSARLLANYDYDDGSMKNVYFDTDQEDLMGSEKGPKRVNLYEEVEKNIAKTTEMVRSSLMLLSIGAGDPSLEYYSGQILTTRILLGGAVLIFPGSVLIGKTEKVEEEEEEEKDITLLAVYEVMSMTKKTYEAMLPYYSFIYNSKYRYLLEPDERIVDDHAYDFKFIKWLRDYVHEKIDPLDLFLTTYIEAICILEKACKRALYYKYPIALFKIPVELGKVDDYIQQFKSKDHLTMKIMFYGICMSAIFHYKLYQRTGFYGEYIEFYKNYSFKKFNGKFEDTVDQSFYDFVEARQKSKLPYDFNIINIIGSPIDEIITSEFDLMNLETPDVFC